MKYCSIDCETCGLDPKQHDILSFAAVIDDLSKPNVDVNLLPKFHCYFIKDNKTYTGQLEALAMHAEIFKNLSGQNPFQDKNGNYFIYANRLGNVFDEFLQENYFNDTEFEKQKSINVAGKNFAMFDYHFLKNQTNLFDVVSIKHRILDPSIAFWENGDLNLPDTLTCKKRAKIETPNNHKAIEDAIDVILLLRKAFKNYKKI